MKSVRFFAVFSFLLLISNMIACQQINPIDVDTSQTNRKYFMRKNLHGYNVVIIGGTGGIGRAFSRLMSTMGANITVVGQVFRDSDLHGITFLKADLSLMSEAKRIGQLLSKQSFDICIFTAGVFSALKKQETVEGIERDLAISYLSRLVILRELAPALGKNRSDHMIPRVFIMGYPGKDHIGDVDNLNSEKSYTFAKAHLNTVAGNEILIFDSAEKYPDIKFFGLNPGIIRTNIRNNLLGMNTFISWFIESLIGLFNQDTETYAKLMVPIITSINLESYNKLIYDKKGITIQPSVGLTPEYITRFMETSEKLILKTKGSKN